VSTGPSESRGLLPIIAGAAAGERRDGSAVHNSADRAGASAPLWVSASDGGTAPARHAGESQTRFTADAGRQPAGRAAARMVFDKTGALANVKRHDYLPFGEELSAGVGQRTTTLGYGAADGVRQKFTQKERDNETGLDYSMHRYYSNVQGRFTSVDPENAGAYPGNPQTWNGYSYALNQPMLYSDPDGLKVRVCGTDGRCTDSDTDLTDEQWNKWFGGDKSVKLKGGNIYKNGELIGTYQQLSCDSCYYDIFELGRQVTRADPGGRAVRLYGKAALAGLSLPGAAAGYVAIGVFSVIVPVYDEPDEDVFAGSIQADRQAAVRDAWRQEAERARTGQPTNTPFTADELRELRDTGKVSGYEGHHTESVSSNPQSARDASKIKFVKGRAAHLSEHGGNWRNRTPLIRRR
jgi:RHS repeat-associated protein